MHLKKLSFKNSHQIWVSLYQCLNRKNVAEEDIKAKSLSSEISKRFNLFEYLDNHNETFIKCKSQSNQTLEKVCGKDEFESIKKNEAISCERNNSDVPVRLTKGDICRDLQFLKNMTYPKNNISYVEKRLYYGKKKLCNKCDQYQKFNFSSLSLSFIYICTHYSILSGRPDIL